MYRGLRRWVKFPDFKALLMDYDMFLVVETKLDKYDRINIENYNFLNKTRTQTILIELEDSVHFRKAI